MSFIQLPVIYESLPNLKAGVVVEAVDPLDGTIFYVEGMAPYPVYTYGLDGYYVDGYQVTDSQGNHHYLPATDVARVQIKQGSVAQ